MAVLQLPIPTQPPADAASSAGVNNASDSPHQRRTPSPIRSFGSNTNFSTTPVTSNLAAFHGHSSVTNNGSASGANFVQTIGVGGFPAANNNMFGQLPFSTPAQQQQRPASFLQMQPPQQNMALGPGMQNQYNAVGNLNPQWNMSMMQGLKLQSAQPPNNLLGPVTVGGGAGLVGSGRSTNAPIANMSRGGDVGAFGNMNRMVTNTSTVGGTSATSNTAAAGRGDAGPFGNRSSYANRGQRPPLLPMTSSSSTVSIGRNMKDQQRGTTPTIGMQSTTTNNGMAGLPTGPNEDDFGEGLDGYTTGAPEVALTTGLVSLSVHEALTFDGVEIALHPDVFASSNGKKTLDGKRDDGANANRRLRPGDLVEIQVWAARPGMAAETSSQSSSVTKPPMKSGTLPSLHSRNISLATVTSSISNTSFMNTPRPLNTNVITTSHAPPLPKVVGGDGMSASFGDSPSNASLFGENLVGSHSEDVGDPTGVLHGENLLEMPNIEQAPVGNNISSVLSGAASNLFRKMSAPSVDAGPPPHGGNTSDENSTIQTHSRDNSLLTNSTLGALHSRDSSLVTATASWMNSLNTSNSKEETSPSTAFMEPVSEGLPQLHPLITNLSQHSIASPESQVLPMRRESSLLASSSSGVPPPPPHPLASSSGPSNPSVDSTPSSSHPSSPRNQRSTPMSTPPAYPMKNPAPREQASVLSISPARPGPGDILSPETTASKTRKRASTADSPSGSDPPNGDAAPSHTRNHSIAMTGASTHRRYRSNIPPDAIPASSAQLLPPSVVGSVVSQKCGTAASTEKNDGSIAEDVHQLLQRTHHVKMSFIMPVSEGSLSSIKSGARTQVSLLRAVADLYGITAYDTVTVTQITRSNAPFVRQSIAADFLTITFKDQFVSRGDMYNFQKSFLSSWVYEGKRLTFNGMRTNTKVIRHGDHVVRSGLITEDTKLTFRSRSARIIWLVQMSSEMWDFASPYETVGNQKSQESSCKIYFDKFVDFVRRLFDKWKKLQLTHNLTVVFFSRTYTRHHEGGKASSAVHTDSDGRLFEDHYKIVVENETNASETLIHRMKQEFVSYPKEVGWSLNLGNERTPSTASQGNVLEAINITLNLLHLHYVDRDLHRTGNSIVIITPGNGVFEIEKNLAGITKQRMMDNGIGSDMLSLGLPPLHVAPFFLYKEKGTTQEEIQGFDDWKTFFEVPHWMNLSFIDYDNEEETMLQKENRSDGDTNAIQGEDDILTQTYIVSNGFMKRSSPKATYSQALQPTPVTPTKQQSTKPQYKHLISDRGFEDILQACRPRNRGEHGSGLPTSLVTLLQRDCPDLVDLKLLNGRLLQKAGLDRGSPRKLVTASDLGGSLTPQRTGNASRSRFLEWGAVNFDDYFAKALNTPQTFNRSCSAGSQSSPASSLTSMGSQRVSSQLFGSSHLQSTMSLEGGGQSVSSVGNAHLSMHKKRPSDGSLASIDNELPEDFGFSAIQKVMADHDQSTFSNTVAAHIRRSEVSPSRTADGLKSSFKEPLRPDSPRLEGRRMPRSQSAMFPTLGKSGIEAALVQYAVSNDGKEDAGASGLLDGHIVPEDPAIRSSLAVSPLSLVGMPFSLDRRTEGLRPSVMRLVAPEAIRNAADGFLPLDFQRKNSFHLRKRDEVNNQIKAMGQNEVRNSQRDKHKDNGIQQLEHSAKQTALTGDTGDACTPAVSPQRAKTKKPINRKPQHHHSHHRRRNPWVLNPFRQEDEDEVLAKRTHNRRRWSHVFPLGEDEFKRHAGPNWKSLCQPAILPMTIDFHPTPQELEDQAKFMIKQYSVTLPPMDETTYKSHKELLDDLVMQRMRQDFQLVPRSIIQQNARRDTTDTVLEATLSMGHKIQRLSYNPSSDSVDVVQYYAKFAEDETPQTYRYLLWSTLRQDYVSVFQNFTKYTLPYKWNELDMLIGGDAVTTIIEGMRHPRISFVIIPDKFEDSQGEEAYLSKFQRLVEYFSKLQPKESKGINIEMHTSANASPQASSGDKRFVVDLRKKRDDKYEWMELVHDSNCDTRRTFRMTIQWLVAVASKIDQQAQLLSRRCSQYGLKLVSVPHFSCLKSCFMNPFAVPITIPVHNKNCVDTIERALTTKFDFVFDGIHMADPNEIDNLDRFDFVVNKWSIKKRKKFVPAHQFLHRSGTIFMRLLRDTRGSAIITIYLNSRHIAGDKQLLTQARAVFHSVEQHISEVTNNVM